MIGPILNNAYKSHNNRDPLGIDGISQSIVGDLCPIINSVTPHAIYWIFVNWIYYDLYENRKTTDMSEKILNAYIKKLNYFMVLGNILNGVDVSDMVGVTNIRALPKDLDTYSYNDSYIQTLTGINYYRAALTTAGFITNFDENQIEQFQHFKFTQKGRKLALSLNNLITNCDFYMKYISNDLYESIPREDIKEFGRIVSFKLERLDESKKLLKEYFFDTITKLSLQYDFIKYLYYDLKIKDISDNGLRFFLYDYFSERSLNNQCPDNLKILVKGWEVLVSRHFFTNAVEMIFSYVLEMLIAPIRIDDFVNRLLESIPDSKLSDYIDKYDLNGNKIDELLSYGRNKRNSHEQSIENSIKILCSLYNRLNNREDLNQDFLNLNNEGTSISLNEMISDIDLYRERNIRDYAEYIIKEYVIKQHIETAQRKMSLNEDSFFFGYYNDIIYNINSYEYDFWYQNLRINNLFQVMNELDMLGGE